MAAGWTVMVIVMVEVVTLVTTVVALKGWRYWWWGMVGRIDWHMTLEWGCDAGGVWWGGVETGGVIVMVEWGWQLLLMKTPLSMALPVAQVTVSRVL
jgi:hypothetical protein